MNSGDGRRRILDLARRLFSLLAIGTIASYLWLHREQLTGLMFAAKPLRILLAAAIFAALHFVIAAAFWFVQSALGIRRPFRRALDSYMLRLPARYIPGGVWHALSRYIDIHDEQYAGKRNLLRVFVVENGLVGMAGLSLSAIALVCFPIGERSGIFAALLALSAIVIAAALVYVARATRPAPIPRELLSAFALLSINWLGVALAFGVFFLAVTTMTACAMPAVGASYLTSASLGFVAVFAPQGWGVAEFVLALLHPCDVAAPVAVAALTGFRLIGALADAVLFLFWRLFALRRSAISGSVD